MWEHSLTQMTQKRQILTTDARMGRLHSTTACCSHSSTLEKIRTTTSPCNSMIEISSNPMTWLVILSWIFRCLLRMCLSASVLCSSQSNTMKITWWRSNQIWNWNSKTAPLSISRLGKPTRKLVRYQAKERSESKLIFFSRTSKFHSPYNIII
jgi:hypothetical protein